MKKTALVLLGLVLVLGFTGCDATLAVFSPSVVPSELEDSRFDGAFSYYENWVASDGINERYEYTVLEFDGTNKASYYTKRYSYSSYSGWSYTGDYIGDYYLWDIEFDIDNGNYRWKLWDNSYSEWDDWENYSFSSDRSTLTLLNFYNIDGNDKVLTKDTDRNATTRMSKETNKTTNDINDLIHDKQLYMK